MATDKRSKSAGRRPGKPQRVRGRAVVVKTHSGTTQTMIFYTCSACGSQHRVAEYGLRVRACRRGLVFVAAGGLQ